SMRRRAPPCGRSGGPCPRYESIEMTRQIAIIGDRFMLPEVFRREIEKACAGANIEIRTLEHAWPDEPMEHGYAVAGLDGLKEYFGDPDEVVDFVGEAEILVT